jgi:hypothetical protein
MRYLADFNRDWLQIMRAILAAEGITYDAQATHEELSLTFWNMVTRRVPRVPRAVSFANNFPTPAPEQAGLDALIEKFRAGEDVNPHLSRKRLDAGDANFHDGLLNDWGIQHFHLGPNGARTNDCLFAVVRDDHVYGLAVLPHGAYGEVDLVQRIHDSWPQLLLGVKTTLLPTMTPPTAAEIKKARRAGLSPLVQVADGTVYAPIGGGITTARVGGSVVSLSDYGFEFVSACQEWFDQVAPRNLEAAQDAGMSLPDPATFTLMYERNVFFAVEREAKIKVRLGVLYDFPIA